MGTVYPPSYAPRFTVTIDGSEYPEYDLVTDIVADTTIDGADYFEITLTNTFVHEHQSFDDLTWGAFKPEPGEEKEVEIAMGYGEGFDGDPPVFVGTIESVRKEFPPHDPPRVVVSGYGPTRGMMKGRVNDSWDETPLLSEIVGAVTGDHGVPTQIDEAAQIALRDIEHVQDESAYHYVRRLADKFGFEFFYSAGEGHFRPKPAGDPPEGPVATLFYGESMESFSAELKKPDHGAVQVRHWDEQAEEEIVGEASNSEPGGTEIYARQVESAGEAQSIAESMLESSQVQGSVETFGVPSITAGRVIVLDGVGEEFAEEYYVTDATHRFGSEGYRMSIEVIKLE